MKYLALLASCILVSTCATLTPDQIQGYAKAGHTIVSNTERDVITGDKVVKQLKSK